MRTRLAALLACLLLLYAALPGAALAVTNTVGGVTLTTPDTYGSCTATGDTLTATNNAAYDRRLTGQVNVEYVVGSSRLLVQSYPVNTILPPAQSFNLAVAYPPSSQWPLAQSPNDPQMRELHVDVQLEVWEYEFANPTNWLLIGSLGYGQDWDIFCRDAPPPPTFQGCTPGYYKNHTSLQAWGGVNSTTKLGKVFTKTPATLANYTLLRALSFQGGETLDGAKEILLRAGVAAYINAGHPAVDYPIGVEDVKLRVNGALASNNRDTIIAMASELDSFNNLSCPLGR